jgi:hypothetical protein
MSNHPIWEFDGNENSPTFKPSLKYLGYRCCHIVLTKGILNYCSDSFHKFSGKSIALPDWPADAVGPFGG